ncbi:DUF3021 family protein [Ligilactobacillus sp. LYQ60]|uniref:DUF3021 family protein n=1 Tax=unclassified Ligilactobacillus TaxID=2767920 RepID=UPI003851A768
MKRKGLMFFRIMVLGAMIAVCCQVLGALVFQTTVVISRAELGSLFVFGALGGLLSYFVVVQEYLPQVLAVFLHFVVFWGGILLINLAWLHAFPGTLVACAGYTVSFVAMYVIAWGIALLVNHHVVALVNKKLQERR